MTSKNSTVIMSRDDENPEVTVTIDQNCRSVSNVEWVSSDATAANYFSTITFVPSYPSNDTSRWSEVSATGYQFAFPPGNVTGNSPFPGADGISANFPQAISSLSVGVVVAGLLCSTFNILVTASQRRDAYTHYMLAMISTDSLFLLCYAQRELATLLSDPTSLFYHVSSWYISTITGTACRRAAITLNLLASAERFLALIYPFKTASSGLRSYSRAVAISVVVVTLLGHVPHVLEFDFVHVEEVWSLSPSSIVLANGKTFLALRNAIRITFFYVPVTMSLVVNLALVFALRLYVSERKGIVKNRGAGPIRRAQTAEQQQQLPQQQQQQQQEQQHQQKGVFAKTTRLVLLLTFVFVFLALPRAVSSTMDTIFSNHSGLPRPYSWNPLVSRLADLAAYCTQPSLLAVCLVCSRRFRNRLSDLLLRRICSESNFSSRMST